MASRTKQPNAPPAPAKELDWSHLLEEALTAPGSLGDTYSRFYSYSYLNQILLLSQGVPLEPVATYKRWASMNRQVQRGARAAAILRPITVKLKDEVDDKGQPKTITKFKPVNCIFPVSMTEGDPLPDYEPPAWSKERALGALGITMTKFAEFDGNAAGYSVGREVAINPVAPYPLKTLIHECGHIVVGHTAEDPSEYQEHRGIKEFEAEGTAYLVMNELEVPEEQWSPSESRAYVQHWLRNSDPPQRSIRSVFSATDAILKAGRPAAVEVAA
jgi:hypothetical protein